MLCELDLRPVYLIIWMDLSYELFVSVNVPLMDFWVRKPH